MAGAGEGAAEDLLSSSERLSALSSGGLMGALSAFSGSEEVAAAAGVASAGAAARALRRPMV